MEFVFFEIHNSNYFIFIFDFRSKFSAKLNKFHYPPPRRSIALDVALGRLQGAMTGQ